MFQRALHILLAAGLAAGAVTAAVAGGAGERQRVDDHRTDLQLLENRLRGLSFHEQQQRNREQDRRAAGAPLARPDVPIIRPGCAPSTSGSRFSGGC